LLPHETQGISIPNPPASPKTDVLHPSFPSQITCFTFASPFVYNSIADCNSMSFPSLLAAMVVTSEKLNSTNFKNLHHVVESTRINTIGISCGL
jgi:hypothetical protein